MTWRESTRSEIQTYYDEEFPSYEASLPAFITPHDPKEYALAFSNPYPTRQLGRRPFIRRSTRRDTGTDDGGPPVFDSFDELLAFIRYPAENDPLSGSSALADPAFVDAQRPVPEAVYYAADMWTRPWLLWIDIDAKDVARTRARTRYPDADNPVEAAGILDADPTGYPYAFEDVRQAIQYGFDVESFFTEDLCAAETMVVYSGQGCHVYLLDDDPYHRYDEAAREIINDVLTTDYEIPIDTVVTADQSRVARLPYSLHAGVSRIVTPISDPEYDFIENPLPRFLTDDETADPTAEGDVIALPGDQA
jgi:hypothetical protein